MNRQEFREFLRRHELSQLRFSNMIGMGQKSVSGWAIGKNPVPDYVTAYCRLFEKLSDQVKQEEIKEYG